jgi:predicted Fe-Mo cluster-binding NifX family protein
MKVGVVLEDENGIYGNVSERLEQCKYFFLADIDTNKKKIIGTRIVPSAARHGGNERIVVDEILRYKVTHIIAGDIDMGAQRKFADAGVQVFDYSGKVKDSLNDFMNNVFPSANV